MTDVNSFTEAIPLVEYWMPEEYEAGLCSEKEIGKEKRPLIEARRLAQRAAPLAIKALVEVARDSDHAGARVKAANALLDRGWGRPDDNRVLEANTARLQGIRDEMPWVSARRLMYQMEARLAEDIVPKDRAAPDELAPSEPAAEAPSTAAQHEFPEVGSRVASPAPRASTDVRKEHGPRGSARGK